MVRKCLIGLQKRELHEALQSMRVRQKTEEFREVYAARAGIESNHAQGISSCGLRHSRYCGFAKTRLQHIVTAAAIDFLRITSWIDGVPLAPTRCSHFAALQLLAA